MLDKILYAVGGQYIWITTILTLLTNSYNNRIPLLSRQFLVLPNRILRHAQPKPVQGCSQAKVFQQSAKISTGI
jgi:hypothetical protein